MQTGTQIERTHKRTVKRKKERKKERKNERERVISSIYCFLISTF
jgi:hypothetical protein